MCDCFVITLLSYYAETFAANHMTVYDGVTFGNTHIVESDITAWNNTVTALDTKANINSPEFTGTPTVTTPGVAERSTRIANTIYVMRALSNSIAPLEATNKASKAYSVDDYLIMNGLLYKVTTAIAQGATIIAGTNVEQKYITDELKTLFAAI